MSPASPTSATGMDTPEFWYCVKHAAVETRDGCPNKDRLGPYATAAEAGQALERTQARNEEWDNDPAWNDDEDQDEAPQAP